MDIKEIKEEKLKAEQEINKILAELHTKTYPHVFLEKITVIHDITGKKLVDIKLVF